MNGYYGHVAEWHPLTWGSDEPMVSVSLIGRVGNEPALNFNLDPHGDDPWTFYERELDAAD